MNDSERYSERCSKVGVYVCVGDLYRAIGKKYDNMKLDYSKYLDYIQDNIGDIVTADAYLAIHNGSDKFIRCLERYGYEVHSFTRLKKYNWHVGVAVDIMASLENGVIDTIVLGSSSMEFIPLLKDLKGRIDPIYTILFGSNVNLYMHRYADECIEIGADLLESVE